MLWQFSDVVIALINNTGMEFHPSLIHMVGPFVYVMPKESDIYYSFQRVQERINTVWGGGGIASKLANFIMLLRSLNPDLYDHFEDEELEPNAWALSWLDFLLAKELPFSCVLRLWDTYFAEEDGQAPKERVLVCGVWVCQRGRESVSECAILASELRIVCVFSGLAGLKMHPYVCLAILGACKEELMETEQPELQARLERLPRTLDIDMIITQVTSHTARLGHAHPAPQRQAYNIREICNDLM